MDDSLKSGMTFNPKLAWEDEPIHGLNSVSSGKSSQKSTEKLIIKFGKRTEARLRKLSLPSKPFSKTEQEISPRLQHSNQHGVRRKISVPAGINTKLLNKCNSEEKNLDKTSVRSSSLPSVFVPDENNGGKIIATAMHLEHIHRVRRYFPALVTPEEDKGNRQTDEIHANIMHLEHIHRVRRDQQSRHRQHSDSDRSIVCLKDSSTQTNEEEEQFENREVRFGSIYSILQFCMYHHFDTAF